MHQADDYGLWPGRTATNGAAYGVSEPCVDVLPGFEEVSRHCHHVDRAILRDRFSGGEVIEAVLHAHPPGAGRLRGLDGDDELPHFVRFS